MNIQPTMSRRRLRQARGGQITFAPAIIFNRITGEEHHSHTRIFVHQSLHPGDIKALALDGMQMFAMNGEHFFVSPSLKFALEANEFGYLQFSEGLSGFAGAA